jgi:hypothetical protein
MFRNVAGISMGFLMPLSVADVSDLDVLIPFFMKNSDVIRVAMFTTRQELILPDGSSRGAAHRADAAEVAEKIAAHYGFEYCGYLGKVKSDGISWLFGMAFLSGGKVMGWADAAAFRAMQERHFKREGRYYTIRNDVPRFSELFPFALLNKSLRKAFIHYAVSGCREGINPQAVIVLDTPSKRKDGWDFCAGCPDAMLYNGRLVPSCLLENVKAGEDIAM